MARILWIHPKQVLGGHGGAELRTRTLLSPILGAGHRVLLAQRGTARAHTRIACLERLDLRLRAGLLNYAANLASPRPLRAPRIQLPALPEAKAAVSAFEPEICIVSELATLDLAQRLMPAGVQWIYDAHNVEPALFAQLAIAERNAVRRMTCAIDARRFARDQASVLGGATAVIAVSQADLDGLRSEHPGFRGIVVPSSVPLHDAAEPHEAPPVVLFVGTLDYLPNIEAVDELLTRVMPGVRVTVPNARLVVVGRSADGGLRRRMAASTWCEWHEDVPDLGPFYRQARCVAIPLFTGSGTRLKTYEAMSYGVPVVGSPLAFEGIEIRDGHTGRCAATTVQSVRAITDLLRAPEVAKRIGHNSRDYFINSLAPDAAAAPLLGLIDDLTSRSRAAVLR